MKIVISKHAGRALRKSHKRVLIARKITELAAKPEAQAANIKRLQGKPGFRMRVQDWRILFRIENDVLYVDEIEPRGSVYEDRK